MQSPSATIVLIAHTVVALAIIAAATVLLALHDLDSATAVATIAVGVTLVGGSAGNLAAVGRVSAGTTIVPAAMLQQLTDYATTNTPAAVQVQPPATIAVEPGPAQV